MVYGHHIDERHDDGNRKKFSWGEDWERRWLRWRQRVGVRQQPTAHRRCCRAGAAPSCTRMVPDAPLEPWNARQQPSLGRVTLRQQKRWKPANETGKVQLWPSALKPRQLSYLLLLLLLLPPEHGDNQKWNNLLKSLLAGVPHSPLKVNFSLIISNNNYKNSTSINGKL